jgi:hypothetical protein
LVPGNKGVKDVAPDIVEGSSDKIQLKAKPRFGAYGGGNFLSSPSLICFSDVSFATCSCPESIRLRLIIKASFPLQIIEHLFKQLRASPDCERCPLLTVIQGRIIDRLLYLYPCLIQCLFNAQPLFSFHGSKSPIKFILFSADGFNRKNVDLTSAPTLQYVGLNTKGTPLDPATVKDDAIGGVTDPASIPGRVKDRAETIASKLPNVPSLPKLPNVRIWGLGD